MMLHKSPFFSIYFGSAADGIYPRDYQLLEGKNLLAQDMFAPLKQRMHLNGLLFLKQTHGVKGIIVRPDTLSFEQSFSSEGDFLVTQMPGVGIGVMTADCLPIVAVDVQRNTVAIAHAGWRGSVAGIALKLIQSMTQGADSTQAIKIYFGPCAQACCYKVDQEFMDNITGVPFAAQAIRVKADGIYFDLLQFNRLCLQDIGIKPDLICQGYSQCTLCDRRFFSYRRDGQLAGRQMTVVSLD